MLLLPPQIWEPIGHKVGNLSLVNRQRALSFGLQKSECNSLRHIEVWIRPPQKIEGWLKRKLNIEYQCVEIPTKATYYKCFNINAICDDPEFFYSPDVWPDGIFVRKFYFQRENKGQRKVGHIPDLNNDTSSPNVVVNKNTPTNALTVGITEQSGSNNV